MGILQAAGSDQLPNILNQQINQNIDQLNDNLLKSAGPNQNKQNLTNNLLQALQK